MVSKKLFFLILGISAGIVVGVSLFVIEPRSRSGESLDLAKKEIEVRTTYERDVKTLVNEYLFGRQGKDTTELLTSIRERLLTLRAPKELRDFHLKFVTSIDTALYAPSEARASSSPIDDFLNTETWVGVHNENTFDR